MRNIVALIVAILVVGALTPLAIEMQFTPYPPGFLVVSMIGVAVFTLMTVVPAFAFLHSRRMDRPPQIIAMSFLCAFFCWLAFGFFSKANFQQVGAVVLVRDGAFTQAGLAALFSQAVLLGLAGIAGGLCFLLLRGRRADRDGG